MVKWPSKQTKARVFFFFFLSQDEHLNIDGVNATKNLPYLACELRILSLHLQY